MRIALVGAGGRLGVPLGRELEAAGHELRRLHRASAAHPVDLATGAGLTAALAGVEVVIHAHNATRRPDRVLVDGSRRLLERAEPGCHHVLVSIVGVDRVAPYTPYYAAKLAQEQLVLAAAPEHSIVRSTQFHEWVGGLAAGAGRLGLELRSGLPLAPVSVREAAAVIARVATGAPRGDPPWRLAGPETLTVSQLRTRRGLPVPLPLPRRLAATLRSGALLEPTPDVRGVLTYGQWLAEARGRPWRPLPPAGR